MDAVGTVPLIRECVSRATSRGQVPLVPSSALAPDPLDSRDAPEDEAGSPEPTVGDRVHVGIQPQPVNVEISCLTEARSVPSTSWTICVAKSSRRG